jgi:hypothetical protein
MTWYQKALWWILSGSSGGGLDARITVPVNAATNVSVNGDGSGNLLANVRIDGTPNKIDGWIDTSGARLPVTSVTAQGSKIWQLAFNGVPPTPGGIWYFLVVRVTVGNEGTPDTYFSVTDEIRFKAM